MIRTLWEYCQQGSYTVRRRLLAGFPKGPGGRGRRHGPGRTLLQLTHGLDWRGDHSLLARFFLCSDHPVLSIHGVPFRQLGQQKKQRADLGWRPVVFPMIRFCFTLSGSPVAASGPGRWGPSFARPIPMKSLRSAQGVPVAARQVPCG